MNEGIVQIILAVIALLGTVITAVIAPYIREKYSKEQRDKIRTYADIAVRAADQVLKLEDPHGKKRKAFVLDFMESKGFKLTEHELNIIIEAAVLDLNKAINEAME